MYPGLRSVETSRLNLLSDVLVGHGSEISGSKGRQKLAEAPSQGQVCEQVGDGTVPLAGPLGAAGSCTSRAGTAAPGAARG